MNEYVFKVIFNVNSKEGVRVFKQFIGLGVLAAILCLLFFSTGGLLWGVNAVIFLLLTGVLLTFLMSLRAGKTPVITRYALLMNAEDTVAERKYTRIVTWVWVMFFSVLWGLKLNGLWDLNQTLGVVEGAFYMGSALLFVAEFYIRPLFLPAHKGAVLWRFLLQLSQVSVKEIWQFDAKK